MKLTQLLSQFKRFGKKTFALLRGELLHIELGSSARFRAFLLKQSQISYLVIRGFMVDRCSLHASSLSFISMLSIVPLLAFGFAVFKGFGAQNAIRPLIEKLAAGQQDVMFTLLEYIDRTNVGALGTIGIVTLALTVILTFSKVEKTFNSIWGVKRSRVLGRKITDYLSIAIVVPILVIATTGVNTTLASNALIHKLRGIVLIDNVFQAGLRLIPYITIWIAFTFMYSFIPNTKVRLWPALYSGIFAGTLWQLLQYAYIHFIVGVSHYNAIYGTFASLPIFMVWLYSGWESILLGAEISYVRQNFHSIKEQTDPRMVSEHEKQVLTIRILYAIVDSFVRSEPLWNSERLAERLGIPVKVVRSILFQLIDLRWLAETLQGSLTVVLSIPPDELTIRKTVTAMRHWSLKQFTYEHDAISKQIELVLRRFFDVSDSAGMDMPLLNLIEPKPTKLVNDKGSTI